MFKCFSAPKYKRYELESTYYGSYNSCDLYYYEEDYSKVRSDDKVLIIRNGNKPWDFKTALIWESEEKTIRILKELDYSEDITNAFLMLYERVKYNEKI